MAYDFGTLKIATFSGINDSPMEPTASKAGNGSHLIAKFNGLIDSYQETANQLTTQGSSTAQGQGWKVLSDSQATSYNAVLGDKILVSDRYGSGMLEIVAPDSNNIVEGSMFSIINFSATIISLKGIIVLNERGNITSISFTQKKQILDLIYLSDSWQEMTQASALTVSYQQVVD